MSTRIDGQIWVGKKTPNNLYYHINGEDRALTNVLSYNYDNTETLHAGTLVTLKDDSLQNAQYPNNIDNILGVVLATSEKGESVQVSKNAYLELEREDIESVFMTDDLNLNTNGWVKASEESNTDLKHIGKGCPVYWFIGKINKKTVNNVDTFTYTDPADYKGRLTFSTPSGYKWQRKTVDDISLNIGYDNLPIVAVVTDYTYNSNNELQTLELYLNFSNFDTSIEWNFPYICDKTEGLLSNTIVDGEQTEQSFKLRHGLFVNDITTKSYIDCLVHNSYSNDEYKMNVQVNNVLGSDNSDRYSEIKYSCPEDLYFNISGRVNYRFEKNHGEI